jgi:hypothetical protein
MSKLIGNLADRLVTAFVPKTTAGACPCNDSYFTSCGSSCKLCWANCNCTKVTCSACEYPRSYC